MVTGAGGLVGRAVSEYCASIGDIVLSYDRQSLDIGDVQRVSETIGNDRPNAVINCAAWTDVDGCETDQNRAFVANAQGPENLANASREMDAAFVTISTDYVFDGRKEGFYTQQDEVNPESVYAKSKLEGEHRSQLVYPRTIVARTGFVFGPGGNNFLSRVIEHARNRQGLKAISDAYGTPTYSRDLAVRLRELAQADSPGIYHVVNSGAGASFAEFTREALQLSDLADVEVENVTVDSLQRPAKRPRNSRLRCLRTAGIGLRPLPDWRASLGEFARLQNESLGLANTGK